MRENQKSSSVGKRGSRTERAKHMEAEWKERKCAKERAMEEDEKLKAVCSGKDTKEDKESKK